MKTFLFPAKKIFLLLFVFLFYFTCRSEEFIKPLRILNHDVQVKAENNKILEDFIADKNVLLRNSLLLNLELLGQEMNGFRIPEGLLEWRLISDKNNAYSLKVQVPALQPAFSCLLTEIVSEAGRVLQFKFAKGDPETTEVYEVCNNGFDLQGHIIQRTLIKSEKVTGKFLEGTFCEYQDAISPLVFRSCKISNFLIGGNGEKIVTEVREAVGREYNEKGQLRQETVRETRYSYSSTPKKEVYHVKLDPQGRIGSFELMNPEGPEGEREGQEIRLEHFDPKGFPLLRTYKKFHAVKGNKKYLTGKCIRFEVNPEYLITRFSETSFDIREGSSGEADEDRIFQHSFLVFNLSYNERGQILRRRIVNTSFIYPTPEGKKIRLWVLDSLREISYEYDQEKTLSALTAKFQSFLPEGGLLDVRKVEVKILERLPIREPKSIQLVIFEKNGEKNIEENFTEDCCYIVDELEFGDLFTPPVSGTDFDLGIDALSSEGTPSGLLICRFQREGEKKKYQKPQKALYK